MEPEGSLSKSARVSGWRSALAWTVTGSLLVLTLTGLSLWLLPFSVANQITVIVHTLLGLFFTIPTVIYTLRHWRRYADFPLTHVKLLGYLAMVASAICLVSGGVLTYQATLGIRIDHGWRAAHQWSTVLLAAFCVPHVLLIALRHLPSRDRTGTPEMSRAMRSYMTWSLVSCLVMSVPLIALVLTYSPLEFLSGFPSDYEMWEPRTGLYQENKPFAPSLARTVDNRPIDTRLLAGSEGCGTSGCHEQILKEWQPSAHRYSAMDLPFQAIQLTMARQNGAMSTRYCGGCHDPISLFSGNKNIYTDETDLTGVAGYHEGVSCLSCHSIRETDVKGNANYTMAAPSRYIGEIEYDTGRSEGWRRVRDFLIRAYPGHHTASLSKTMFKKPEYCAACHKQFVDEEINKVGWVQLQNQFDNWKNSKWARDRHDPRKTLECRECHMPLVASSDPAAGDGADHNRTLEDGKHRSHRFIASNQFLPQLMGLEGADEQVRLTESWLKGTFPIPEIQEAWAPPGVPAVSVQLVAPEEVSAGDTVDLQCIVTSNKVGHDFPSGPLDIIQSWLEVRVTDGAGRTVFETGRVDDRGFIDPGAFMFKAEPVDQSGNLIDRHNLWEMVGVRQRRALFPGFADTARFAFACPELAPRSRPVLPARGAFSFEAPGGTALTVRVRLRYRKIDQFLINFLSTVGPFGKPGDRPLTSPITDMHEVSAGIRIRPKTNQTPVLPTAMDLEP